MEKLSVSFAFTSSGGSTLSHNNCEFIAKNIVTERIPQNIVYKQEEIDEFYKKVFGEALAEFNARQKQPCRRIENYLEHIKEGKQEKPWYEIIVQFGDKDTAGVGTENGELVTKMLDEYMRDFEKRNPNLKVFNAVLHLDEASPHIHIDFVPVAVNTNKKRGLPLKNSMSEALSQQGIKSDGIGNNERSKWFEVEKQYMCDILRNHNLEIDVKNVKHTHQEINDFKRMQDSIKERDTRIKKMLEPQEIEKLSPADVARLKTENEVLHKQVEQKSKKLETLEQRMTDDFKLVKIINEEKAEYVADILREQKIKVLADVAGLYVPKWAVNQAEQIAQDYKTAPTTWREDLKILIDRLIYQSKDVPHLLDELRKRGYDVKHQKYISIKPSGDNSFRAVRTKTLGDDYSEEALAQRIAEKDKYPNRFKERVNTTAGAEQKYYLVMCEVTDLIVAMKKSPRKDNRNGIYSIRNDYHINQLAAQLKTINAEHINSVDDLKNRIDNLSKTIESKTNTVARLKKEQADTKDLVGACEFYFKNANSKLDNYARMRLSVAKEKMDENGITSESQIADLRQKFHDTDKIIVTLQKEIAEATSKQDTFTKVLQTYETLEVGSYIDRLVAEEREKRTEQKQEKEETQKQQEKQKASNTKRGGI